MEYEKYVELKKDVEIYFAKIIKKRFKEYVEENFELRFEPDYQSHRLISDLLSKDGLDVHGMNVNMDGFQLLLEFHHEYQAIDNFPFSGLAVEFENDGNYHIYLSENSFEDEWTVHLEDAFRRYLAFNEKVFVEALNEMKNTHLMFVLKA
jgi:hypothetical protein